MSKEVQYGEAARRILEDDLFNDAFKGVEEATISLWTKETDRTTRDQLWYQLQALEKVRRYLEVAVANGEMAKEEAKETNRN